MEVEFIINKKKEVIMREQKVIKPGTAVFLSTLPVYAIVAKRDNWLKWAEKENTETVESFLEREVESELIPFLILGHYLRHHKKEKKGLIEHRSFQQRWAFSSSSNRVTIVYDLSDLIGYLFQFSHFIDSFVTYPRVAYNELIALSNYLEDSNNPILRDRYRKSFDLFDKALG